MIQVVEILHKFRCQTLEHSDLIVVNSPKLINPKVVLGLSTQFEVGDCALLSSNETLPEWLKESAGINCNYYNTLIPMESSVDLEFGSKHWTITIPDGRKYTGSIGEDLTNILL
jgi:dolichyl-phosphate-mannose--protein O-mannosyl transferase